MPIKNYLLFAISVCIANPAFAESCGKIISNSHVPHGDYAVKLEKHNGKRLNIPKRYRIATSDYEASGFASFKLEPGIHQFRGYALCSAGNSCKRSSILGGTDADEVNFSLKVEKGKSYKIAAGVANERSLIPGKRFEIHIVEESDIQCEGKQLAALETESLIQSTAINNVSL